MRVFLSALTLFLTVLGSLSQGAAKYAPANESRSLIRRDLIPLDIAAIRELAAHLALLADGPRPNSARELYHRAQLLTLSQRLAPGQILARNIETAFLQKSDRPAPAQEELKRAKDNALNCASWMSELPKNTEGHHLAQLLLDVLKPLIKKDPAFKAHDPASAPTRWDAVVGPVSNFEGAPAPVVVASTPRPPKKEETPDLKKSYAVTALLTEVPMISATAAEPPALGLISTSLVITETRKSESLRFQPNPGFDVGPLHRTLLAFFEKNSTPLPKGYTLNINTSQRKYLLENRENILAPIAMMIDAALTGRPLRRNTILFAKLNPDGSLTKPTTTWELLLRLAQLRVPTRTRLIVGQGMLEELTGLLVLDKATFYRDFEVIEASSFDQARELFYADGTTSEALAAACAGYEEVRKKATEAINLGTFLSLAAVEERLVKAAAFSPRHLSAKMLATQSIRRPAYFSEVMAARELDRILIKLADFKPAPDLDPKREARELYKTIREPLDKLERRLQRPESLLLDEALNVIKDLNSIGRTTETENERETIKSDLAAFQENLEGFRKKLRSISAGHDSKE